MSLEWVQQRTVEQIVTFPVPRIVTEILAVNKVVSPFLLEDPFGPISKVNCLLHVNYRVFCPLRPFWAEFKSNLLLLIVLGVNLGLFWKKTFILFVFPYEV